MPDWLWQLDLNIDELDISVNKLSGNIPNTLGFLSASVIDWGSNRFDGPLPLWSSNMTRLYLNDNMFSGPIPHEIGEVMPFLTDLGISRNYLNGSIPLSIGVVYLQSITFGYCPKNERDALVKFKQGFNDPSGRLSSWVGEDCCSWRGVTYNNRNGRIFRLNLHNPYANPDDMFDTSGTAHELGGKIDPSLLHLRDLTYRT
ncbi:hypothetical protein GH714_009123 [Hevea brasiliensis]|uniref:Leucine-rich repeat-containing N-terminal plant-type domain-containing protein n=1 Tax=Hevea brasiliensis TaxID=3981 RepID=A0A6A6LWW7_HEVBR|nr:hypothetical protein GH714_009123 [Hevea brasiliensis]